MLTLATPCWDCLYFGLFALPLQSKQGMVSEKGQRRVRRRRVCELNWIHTVGAGGGGGGGGGGGVGGGRVGGGGVGGVCVWGGKK